jgi:activator of HSP90 ATPase
MTKRHACGALALGILTTAWAAAQPVVIHYELDLKVAPQRVYEALLDTKQFSALTGAPAEIQREAGGSFALFSGHIRGRIVELLSNQRIVQAWRAEGWPEGVYSIAHFELKPQGSGTRLVFDHTGFPPDLKAHLEEGWEEHYWAPLRKYFKEN